MEKNEREVTYAEFHHVSTRGRKEKRSHIKFLLLLLNLTPIIKQKLRQRIWRYIKTPRHQMKTWDSITKRAHAFQYRKWRKSASPSVPSTASFSNGVPPSDQPFEEQRAADSRVLLACIAVEGENSSVTVSMCVASRSRNFRSYTELSERTVVLV